MKFSLLLPALFFACIAAGQDALYEEGHTFTGALIGGINFAQIDGDSYYGYHKAGLTIGAQAYAHFSTVFGASMELLYSEKGSRGETIYESPTIGTFVSKYYMNVNYVEVPLMAHIATHRLDVEAGLSAAYLISSKEWLLTDQPVAISDSRNYFNNTDVDVNIGLSGRVYKQFFANIRWQYSLTSIRPPERIPVGYRYGNQGQFNNLFNIRLVYQLKGRE
jgi:hypothetical protein